MKSIYRSTSSIVGALAFSINSLACSVNFDGDEFLTMSQSKGVGPTSTCYVTDLASNSFYALPTSSCQLNFSSIGWLSNQWLFKDLEGKGRFRKTVGDTSINIVIEEKGGFTLSSVTLIRDSEEDEEEIEDCETVELVDVL